MSRIVTRKSRSSGEIRGEGSKKRPRCPYCQGEGRLYERRHIRDLQDVALVVRCDKGCVETLPSHDRNQLWEWWDNPKYWSPKLRVNRLWLPGEWDTDLG